MMKFILEKKSWEKSDVRSLLSCLNSLKTAFIYKNTCASLFGLSSFIIPLHLWLLDQILMLINDSNWAITISNELSLFKWKKYIFYKTQLIRHIFTIRIIYFKNYSNIQYEICTHNFYTGFTFLFIIKSNFE